MTSLSRRPETSFVANGVRWRSLSVASTGSRWKRLPREATSRSTFARDTSTLSGTTKPDRCTRPARLMALSMSGVAPSSFGVTTMRAPGPATSVIGRANRCLTRLRASVTVRPPTSVPPTFTPATITFGCVRRGRCRRGGRRRGASSWPRSSSARSSSSSSPSSSRRPRLHPVQSQGEARRSLRQRRRTREQQS